MNNYLLIKVSGKNIYKFIFKCKNNNINLLKINKINNNSIIIMIDSKDYSLLLKIKSIYEYKIINKRGLIKLKSIINIYKYVCIFFVFGLILLITLSNIIFKVNVISNNNTLNKKVKKELYNLGIKKYSFTKNYDEIEKIKESILIKYKDYIEWLEIKRNGVNYNVILVERKKNKLINDFTSSNIIAKKSGVIKSIIAYGGEKIKKENDYVSKGEVIISGIIKKNDEVKGLTISKAEIYAETWYKVKIEYPLNYKEEIITSNYKYSPYIKIGNNYYELNNYKKYKRENIISHTNRFNIFNIGINKEKELKIINEKLSLLEAKTKAKKKAKNIIRKKLNNNEYIINQKTLNFYQKNSKIVLEEFFSCYENIALEEKIK